MTVAAAKAVLTPPLKFGDPVQISAVRFLEQVERCRDGLRKCKAEGHDHDKQCPDCDGRAYCNCMRCDDEHPCGTCAGTGDWEELVVDACPYLRAFDGAVIVEAQKQVEVA